MHKNKKTQNLHSFSALAFLRGICLSRHQRIWNQHKILRVFDTHIDIFQEKKFWVIIALFAILKCKCEKNCTFSKILPKVKSYFFANIYQSPCDSYWNSKKSIKLKPPNVQYVSLRGTRPNPPPPLPLNHFTRKELYYIKYQSFSPVVWIGSPFPPQASVSPPTWVLGGRHTR